MEKFIVTALLSSLLLVAGCSDDSADHSELDGGRDTVSNQDANAQSDSASAHDTQTDSDARISPDTAPNSDAENKSDSTNDSDTTTDPNVGQSATIDGCNIFPADNPWNQDISGLPLHPRGDEILANMNPTQSLHPDWGNWSTDHYGIPWSSGQGAPALPVTWTASWGDEESDKMPCSAGDYCYPIPADAPIEGGLPATSGDRHVLYLDTSGAPDHCTLYELYNAEPFADGHWTAGNGAVFPLGTNALRPEGWTSADAAGLPILPGLVRVEEVLAGEVDHAIRFTVSDTAKAYIHPATHAAGQDGTDLPPMGLRVRLRADYPVENAPPTAQVILRAMQTYGLILADNGSDWYITGDSDDRWAPLMDDIIQGLDAVHGSDFEVVYTGASIPQ